MNRDSEATGVTDDLAGLGLQSERTRLAWSRTALAFAALGGLLLHGQSRASTLGLVSGALVCACAVATYVLGRVRYRRALRAVEDGQPLLVPRFLACAWAFATVSALLALATLAT